MPKRSAERLVEEAAACDRSADRLEAKGNWCAVRIERDKAQWLRKTAAAVRRGE